MPDRRRARRADDVALADPIICSALTTLVVVAESGSFSAAGRALGVRQSTVSRQVRRVEDHVGVSLFDRSGSGIRPTDAGCRFLERMVHVSRLTRTALQEARDAGVARIGRLRLGFVGSFATSPAKDILSRVRELHPGLKIGLTELGVSELISRVLSCELDCAWVATFRSPEPALLLEPLWLEPLYLATPLHQHLGDIAKWSELSDQVLLARPEAELDLLLSVLKNAGVPPPEIQFHDCSRESLMVLVAEGDGVAILPESFARMGRPGVRFARIAESAAQVAICAMYRRDRDNPALRRLLAITREWLRDNPVKSRPPFGPG